MEGAHAGEAQYLALLADILENGEKRVGRNGTTLSLFGQRLVFNIADAFPLLTTKKVYLRGIIEELLWFLRGSTDVTELQARNVHIWDANSTREFLDSVGLADVPVGQIGAGYGYQWRCFGGDYPTRENGVDQLRYLLSELVMNPTGRRAVLCAWNPKQLAQAALPPCHFTYVFYISADRGLSCQMQMRSCDVGSGLPYNIASTALFTCILAHILHIPVDRIIIITGDTHLYEVHRESAQAQITRTPYKFPTMTIIKPPPSKSATIDAQINWIESLTFEDFKIADYQSHPALPYPMVA